MGLFGLLLFLALATAVGGKKTLHHFPWRIVLGGLILQVVLLFLLRVHPGVYNLLQKVFSVLSEAAFQGGRAAFGQNVHIGAVFVLNCTVTFIFISAIMGLLYYWGIPQFIIKQLTKFLRFALGIGGLSATLATINVIFGMGEACTIVNPYIPTMSPFTFFVMCVSGLSTISLALIVFIAGLGIPAGDLVTAVILSAPASLVFASLLEPPKADEAQSEIKLDSDIFKSESALESFANGAISGLKLSFTVIAVFIATVATVWLVNYFLGLPHRFWLAIPELSLQKIIGYPGALFALLMGVPASEALKVGYLLGCNLCLNEVISFTELLKIQEMLSPRSVRIATFALTGFANFTSLGILYSIVECFAPERKGELRRLLWKALMGGVLASYSSACLASLF